MGAGRIIAVDGKVDRLEGRPQGAEIVNFEKEDPVQSIKALTDSIGVDRAIDAVEVDSQHAHDGPAAKFAKERKRNFQDQARGVAPDGDQWNAGEAPRQAVEWAVEVLAKAGTLAVIGVYSDQANFFPVDKAMNKNLTIKAGNCNHRKYLPHLIELVRSRVVNPIEVLHAKNQPMAKAIDAYKAFDKRELGWLKVELGDLQS